MYTNVEDAETQDPTAGMGDTQTQAEAVSIDEEPLEFDEELVTLAGTLKRKNQRTASYTDKEDKVLCESWMTCGQNAVCGAQQKGTVFWRRVWKHYHEQRKLPPYQIESDRSEASLSKRWSHIQCECSKFQSSYDHVKARPVSGIGVGDILLQALEFHKGMYKTKFTLPHCWDMIKGCPKWIEIYNGLKKGSIDGSKKRSNEDEDDVDLGQSSGGRAVRPRGHKATKQDAKRDMAATQLEETLKSLIAGKEESAAARHEEKRKDKEEARALFMEMQKKKLEIEQERIKAEENRVKLALITEENRIKAEENRVKLALMAEENRIMMADLTIMDPEQRAWILKRQKAIRERDDA